MSRSWPLAFASLLACGPPSVSVDDGEDTTEVTTGLEDTSTTTAAELGSGEDTGVPTDMGTPEPEPASCEIIEGDHSLACDDSPCPVMTDLEIRCPDDEWFVRFGAQVATGADRSWVFAQTHSSEGTRDHYMFELVGGRAQLIDTSSVAPIESRSFTVDAQGVLHMLRHEEVEIDTPTVVTSLRWESPTFSAEPVPNTLWLAHSRGFAFDDAGGLHVVDSNFGTDQEYVHRDSGGVWVSEWVESLNTMSFALTTENQLFYYDSWFEQPELTSWDVSVVVAGIEQTIATGMLEPLSFYAIRKPMPGGTLAFGPEYAGVAQTDAGLRFVALDQLLPTITATARLDVACPLSHQPPCGQTCEAQGVGLAGYNWEALRTADGRTWLIWIENEWDLRFEYVDPEPGGLCLPTLVHDASIATLHVDAIDFDAPELLVPGASLEVRRSDATGSGQFGYAGTHLDASAWGEVITVSMVEGGTELDLDRSLRVLELDTELLP